MKQEVPGLNLHQCTCSSCGILSWGPIGDVSIFLFLPFSLKSIFLKKRHLLKYFLSNNMWHKQIIKIKYRNETKWYCTARTLSLSKNHLDPSFTPYRDPGKGTEWRHRQLFSPITPSPGVLVMWGRIHSLNSSPHSNR